LTKNYQASVETKNVQWVYHAELRKRCHVES